MTRRMQVMSTELGEIEQIDMSEEIHVGINSWFFRASYTVLLALRVDRPSRNACSY